MNVVKSVFAAIDRYWFGYGSPVSLGLFRILIGSITFLNFALISIDLQEWFTENGWVPLRVLSMTQGPIGRHFQFFGADLSLPFEVPRIAFLNSVSDSRIIVAFYALTMVAAMLTALGLWTRVSSIVLALCVVSLHHRNPAILHGGDTVLRICVLYVAIAPSGAACSLDRLVAVFRGTAGATPRQVSLWPQRLIAFNVGVIYLFTAWAKWDGSHWRDGTATWYTSRLGEFARFPVPHFLVEMPMVRITTYATLATEFAMGTLVFYRPFRKWVLLAALGMHGFIEYSMNIPMFAFTICSMYVVFFDGEEIVVRAKRFGANLSRWAITIRMPSNRTLSSRGAAFLEVVDPLGLVRYVPGTGAAWSIDGRPGGDAPRAAWFRSIGAWGIGLVPGLWRRLFGQVLVADPVRSEAQKLPREAARTEA